MSGETDAIGVASVSSPMPSLSRIEDVLRSRGGDGENNIDGRPAAVLVPFCNVDGELSILFIRRSMTLTHHPGQMAFPGGAVDPDDRNLSATAVRETVEEIGVQESEVEIWGTLDPLLTISNFALSPFTGWLSQVSDLKISEQEVSEVVTVPVSALLDHSCDRDETRSTESGFVSRPTYAYNGRVIWGSTGQIVSQLIDCLRQA